MTLTTFGIILVAGGLALIVYALGYYWYWHTYGRYLGKW